MLFENYKLKTGPLPMHDRLVTRLTPMFFEIIDGPFCSGPPGPLGYSASP